jgi:hypothetical protein
MISTHLPALGCECEAHRNLSFTPRVNVSGVCVWPRLVFDEDCTVKYVRRPKRRLQQGPAGLYCHRSSLGHHDLETDGSPKTITRKMVLIALELVVDHVTRACRPALNFQKHSDTLA